MLKSRLALAGLLFGCLAGPGMRPACPQDNAGTRPTPEAASPAGPARDLLRNGGFEAPGAGPRPEGWQALSAGIELAAVDAVRGRALKMTLDKSTADGPGLTYYSDPIHVLPGRRYRASLEVRSEGPSAILFVKGYADFNGREREIYRRQKLVPVRRGEWVRVEIPFTPRPPVGAEVLKRRGLERPEVDRVKVDLFAYHPAGVIYFDSVRVFEDGAAEPTPTPEGGTGAESEGGKPRVGATPKTPLPAGTPPAGQEQSR